MFHIPIVMATDNNYVPLVVSLTSLVENADEDTFYDIYILVDSSFTQKSMEMIRKFLKIYMEHCFLTFKHVGDSFNNTATSITHITRPTYFRLIVPELLNIDKCVYLDVDTIIMSDLQGLFSVSVDDYYVAGVWHPGAVLCEKEDIICKNANIPSAKQYINAGVLVMNLKRLRDDNAVKRFLELVPLKMPSQDQDIINHVCYGKILLIPFKYNVMTKLADISFEDYKDSYSEMELKEAWNMPCIIHYADRNKPWNSGSCIFMDQWWKFCRKSSIYKTISNDFFDDFINGVIYHSQRCSFFTKKIPELFDITFKRKYVIYGAGKRAEQVLTFLKSLGIIPLFVIVSNIERNPSRIVGIEVRDIVDAGPILYDKSIIIAVGEKLHKEIIKNLQKYDCLEIFPLSDNFKADNNR